MKTTSDAHIMLSPCYGCDGYEVVIGGWRNSKSVIRDKRGKPHLGCAATKVGCILIFFMWLFHIIYLLIDTWYFECQSIQNILDKDSF